MRAIPEGGGNIFDHSLVLYGSGMKDGITHEPVDVPIALFGDATGKSKPANTSTARKEPLLTNPHVSLKHVYGVPGDEFNGKELKPVSGLLI